MSQLLQSKLVIVVLALIVGIVGLLVRASIPNLLSILLIFGLSVLLGGISVYVLLKEKIDRITKLSNTDSVTGLYNAKEIERLLSYDIERSKRYKGDLSIMLMDIDNFSTINETYGRKKGDEILRWLSNIILNGTEYTDKKKKEYHGIRNSDIAFRFEGEDKILIIMPETAAKGAFIAAERIREAVMFTPFTQPDSEEYLRITLSTAVVSFDAKTDTVNSMLDRATLLLRKAKITKNHVVIENPIHNGLIVFGNNEDKEPWVKERPTT